MQQRMSSSEFEEWLAFLRMDGRPEDKNALLLAQLNSMVAGIGRDPKSSRPAPTPQQFLAPLYGEMTPQSAWTEGQRETWERYQTALAKRAHERRKRRAN